MTLLFQSSASPYVNAMASAGSLLVCFYFFDQVFPCLSTTENVVSYASWKSRTSLSISANWEGSVLMNTKKKMVNQVASHSCGVSWQSVN